MKLQNLELGARSDALKSSDPCCQARLLLSRAQLEPPASSPRDCWNGLLSFCYGFCELSLSSHHYIDSVQLDVDDRSPARRPHSLNHLLHKGSTITSNLPPPWHTTCPLRRHSALDPARSLILPRQIDRICNDNRPCRNHSPSPSSSNNSNNSNKRCLRHQLKAR
jgi:hypothetical protein